MNILFEINLVQSYNLKLFRFKISMKENTYSIGKFSLLFSAIRNGQHGFAGG